jgi:ribosomal protein S18 acetylase RimI-like enzyme
MCLPVEDAAHYMERAFIEARFDGALPKNFTLVQRPVENGKVDFFIADASKYNLPAVGGFGWSEFPNVGCHIAISHDVYLGEPYRGKGYGSLLLQMREKAFKEAGIQMVLATVRSTNAAEIALLKKANWKKLSDIASANEAVKIELWSKTF